MTAESDAVGSGANRSWADLQEACAEKTATARSVPKAWGPAGSGHDEVYVGKTLLSPARARGYFTAPRSTGFVGLTSQQQSTSRVAHFEPSICQMSHMP